MVKKNFKKAKVSKAVKEYVQKELMENEPLKQNQFSYPSSGVGTTGLTRHDLVIPNIGLGLDRGDTFNQRQGDIIKIHEIDYRVTLNCATLGAFQGRAIMIYEKVTNGLDFPTTDLLYSNTAGACNISNYNYDQMKKWRILYDKPFQIISNYFQTAAGGDAVLLHIHKKFKTPLRVSYGFTATAGTVADVEEGRIVVLLISDNTSVTVVNGIGEVKFTDA